MTTETMTVHQALCELKTLEKRIRKAIDGLLPVDVKENNAKKVQGMDPEAFTKLIKSTNQSVTDLIARMFAIKTAINKYNAEKEISIAGKAYTMAQAIWMMQHGMEMNKLLLARYTKELLKMESRISVANGPDLTKRAEAAVVAAYGSKDKINPEEYNEAITQYKERNQLVLVDPLDIRTKIAELEATIADFEKNVDSAIQSANAVTEITITY